MRLLPLLLCLLLTACAAPVPRPSVPRSLDVPRAFMPLVASLPAPLPEDGCSANATAAAMLAILRAASWQGRAQIVCDARLAAAAQAKADDMAAHVYVNHVSPNGWASNDWARAHGFPLPPWYPAGANHIESVAGGFPFHAPEVVIAAWATSESHWQHIAAAIPYFAAHECLSVGYAATPGRGFYHYWVVMSAPCPE